MTEPENPPYITKVQVFGVWHVNKMEWDERDDDYQVSISKQVGSKAEALVESWDWARRENLEVR